MAAQPSITREHDYEAVATELGRRLVAFNERYAGPRNTEHFALTLRDDANQLAGGLSGELFWTILAVHLLWVEDRYRGIGYGTLLMKEAERIARECGCEVSFLATISFQAPGFYHKLGYRQCGEVPDSPRGEKRLWFYKRLSD
jgi:GNAT superfamily N-acetyltransferase